MFMHMLPFGQSQNPSFNRFILMLFFSFKTHEQVLAKFYKKPKNNDNVHDRILRMNRLLEWRRIFCSSSCVIITRL